MKLKHLPNALGIFRILLCIPLIFLEKFGLVSMIIYITAGLTDTIDGPLARRIKDGKSELGAVLDSIADMVLVIVGIVFIMPAMVLPPFDWLWKAYIIALSFKLSSGLVGYIKHKEFVMLHTYTNKFLAIILWIIPIIYWLSVKLQDLTEASFALKIYIIFVLACIFIITTEEILINLLLKKPSRNIKSIFGVKAANKETDS